MRHQERLLILAGAVAVTLLLHVGAAQLGPAGMLFNLFAPLPVAYAMLCGGPTIGVGVLILVLAALLGIGGPVSALAYLLQFGLAGSLLGLLLGLRWAWDRAVAVSLAGAALAAGTTLGGYAAWKQLSISELVDGYLHGEVEQALSIYRAAELPAEQLAELQRTVEQVAAFLAQAYPALALVVMGLILLVTLLGLNVLSRGRYSLAGPSFNAWKAPEKLIWALIAAGFGFYFGQGTVKLVALNLLTMLLPLYFLQGLAVVRHYFRRKRIPPLFQGLGYALIAFFNPLPLIITGVGVFDLWADFRKPRIKQS